MKHLKCFRGDGKYQVITEEEEKIISEFDEIANQNANYSKKSRRPK